MINSGLWSENLRVSIRSIGANRLRTILTILIIAIGITALVGILTAIEAIKNKITNEFTRMGANTFTIESRSMNIHFGNKRSAAKNFTTIKYQDAQLFKEVFK